MINNTKLKRGSARSSPGVAAILITPMPMMGRMKCQNPGHLAARLGCAETKVATWDDLAFKLIILGWNFVIMGKSPQQHTTLVLGKPTWQGEARSLTASLNPYAFLLANDTWRRIKGYDDGFGVS
ncbi:hypothetical protein Tco_0180827 [Tanacetum coccineum]